MSANEMFSCPLSYGRLLTQCRFIILANKLNLSLIIIPWPGYIDKSYCKQVNHVVSTTPGPSSTFPTYKDRSPLGLG